jgi:hypothetical protein
LSIAGDVESAASCTDWWRERLERDVRQRPHRTKLPTSSGALVIPFAARLRTIQALSGITFGRTAIAAPARSIAKPMAISRNSEPPPRTCAYGTTASCRPASSSVCDLS